VVATFLLVVSATFAARWSLDQKASKFFVLHGIIHGKVHACKWSLLKVREQKYKREHCGAQVESGS
jgi:hypothetical protein